MTGNDEWGMRSYQDEPDATSWGGENVYDVYSLSPGHRARTGCPIAMVRTIMPGAATASPCSS